MAEEFEHDPKNKPEKPDGGTDTGKIPAQAGPETLPPFKGHIYRLKPEELPRVLDGTELTTINGRCIIKGSDYIDPHTQGGYLACGFRPEKCPNWFPQDEKRRAATTLHQSIENINEAHLESPELGDHLWVNGKRLPIFYKKPGHLFFFSEEDVRGKTSITLIEEVFPLKPSELYQGFVEIVGLRREAAIGAVKGYKDADSSASMN